MRILIMLDLYQKVNVGSGKTKGTIDMIFTARQLQEKRQEQNLDLYMTFVDLTKHLTQSVVVGFGTQWHSFVANQIHFFGAAVS